MLFEQTYCTLTLRLLSEKYSKVLASASPIADVKV
jgi:hypothetical protein